MNVLITGATGFVGGHLLRRLSGMKRTHPSLHVRATARRPLDRDLARSADDYFRADLSRECPPLSTDVCIHAAGLADDRSSSSDLQGANVDATRNLLGALHQCRLFVFISSASVYGIGDRVLLPRLRRLMRPPFLFIIGSGAAPASLTDIGHLADVVDAVVFGGDPPRDATFNVADPAVYCLLDVLCGMYRAIHHARPHVIHIPRRLIAGYLRVNEAIGRQPAISRQALGYLTLPCVLDCASAHTALDWRPSGTFFDHAEEIGRSAWAPTR